MASRKSLSRETETNIRESLNEPSCVSLESCQSVIEPLNFSSGDSSVVLSLLQRQSLKPSCVSLKSGQSVIEPLNFSSGDSSVVVSSESFTGKQLDAIFEELEHRVLFLIKKELKSFKKLLSSDCSECSGVEEEEDGQNRVRDEALNITLHVLRTMNQTDLANKLQTEHVPSCLKKHKSRLKEKFQRISEGISNQGKSRLLNDIYTELCITEGGSGEVNNQHEVRQIEMSFRRPETQDTLIKLKDLFKPSLGQNKTIKTVLTKGVSGIGKTVSVQKFILDWAEGKANQDIHLIFPLPFRELNLMKQNISLMELLHRYFMDTTELRITDFRYLKVLFILDGLDECQLPLDFQNNSIFFDEAEPASIDVLLTNLIKGNLLPSALLWMTSWPAAANLIPPECVDHVTEIRGFNDPQKDEYFRKRINYQSLANRILTHIKSSRSLYIMCHIPVFCWISATVLERMLSESESEEIPKTVTQMFTHFLIFQTKLKSLMYDGKYEADADEARKSILSLGKLAFEQMEKGNKIFYEKDLKECGIDVREASVFSGVFTQIFREEFGLYQVKVYSFVHLSFQEFLAALFRWFIVFHEKDAKYCITDLLKSEVDKALESANGHWDLYLRFLLGLSLGSNQTLLRDLLTQTRNTSDSKKEIIKYIKMKISEDLSPEKSISLFHCLNELNDQSLVQEVQKYLHSEGATPLSGVKLSPAQWSALVFVLLNSEKEMDEFKLSKYCKSEEGLLRLMPVIKAFTKADLSDCNLTKKSCSALASALKSNLSSLRELNLNYNNVQDSGVKLLSSGLNNSHCKLKTLNLCNCGIGDAGCVALATALKSNPSHLRELNLNRNMIEGSGIELFSDLLSDPHCKLETLEMSHCSVGEESCAALISSLISNPSHLRELNLNNNTLGDSGVKLLSDLLKDQDCKLENLQLEFCSIGGKGCAYLVAALRENPSYLRDLSLSENKLGDSGVTLLSDLVKVQHCKLEKLQLCGCVIIEKGCAALVSALRSNPSHLRELNLSRNNLGDSAVRLISGLLKDPHCRLEKLKLEFCNIGEESSAALASALKSNTSHLRELNLNYNKLGDSGENLLKALHNKVEKLEFCDIDYLLSPVHMKTKNDEPKNCLIS